MFGYHIILRTPFFKAILEPDPLPLSDPHQWLPGALGQYFLAWEQAQLDGMLADIFGYNALQLGLPSVDLLQVNRMPLRLTVVRRLDDVEAERSTVIADDAALPFGAASLDLVVLAHVLEFAASPHSVLREIDRVLVAEGSVVICGFNPFSLWGWRRWLGTKKEWPWRGQYLSAPRVRDWLTLLGFEVQITRMGCFVPVVGSIKWLSRWKWLDRIGCRLWPMCGAVWIVHGIKRVKGVRLIQPNWREKRLTGKKLSAVARRLGDGPNTQKNEE